MLLPALLANPSVSAESLFELAPSAGREVVEVMMKSERVKHSPTILHALLSNPNLSWNSGRDNKKPDRARARGASHAGTGCAGSECVGAE